MSVKMPGSIASSISECAQVRDPDLERTFMGASRDAECARTISGSRLSQGFRNVTGSRVSPPSSCGAAFTSATRPATAASTRPSPAVSTDVGGFMPLLFSENNVPTWEIRRKNGVRNGELGKTSGRRISAPSAFLPLRDRPRRDQFDPVRRQAGGETIAVCARRTAAVGRVETWRRALGRACLFPPLSSGRALVAQP
jgi:hypothetical protein